MGLSYLVVLLLMVGAYHDLREGKIPTYLNVAVLGVLAASFALTLGEAVGGSGVAVSSLIASLLAFSLFLVSWVGPADSKFLMAAVLSLGFGSVYQPLWFVGVSLVLWVVFPTADGLRAIDLKLATPILVLCVITPPLGVVLVLLYLGYLKYVEVKLFSPSEGPGGYPGKVFPFLHVLFIVVVLHILAPGVLYAPLCMLA